MTDLDPEETTLTPPGDFGCTYCNDATRVAHLPVVNRVRREATRETVLTYQCPRCHLQAVRTVPDAIMRHVPAPGRMDLGVVEGRL